MAAKHELKIQQSHSPEALTMFATCSWPSLCEQSELQCWRRNKRLCGPVQISAARALPLTFDISILNTPSYASLLFVKTIITPAVPNKKSSIRGRKQHYLRPRVVLPPAAGSTNGGRGSITSYRSCWSWSSPKPRRFSFRRNQENQHRGPVADGAEEHKDVPDAVEIRPFVVGEEISAARVKQALKENAQQRWRGER